uniref:Uncharacterized protein n=1 Tax=Chromera velia CCMP2878 TaxID=1169474 RepID=A0A0G4GLR7_9ALVE|eukprot:Cvel_4878.t1-p1 / transcript=Cvel_4878.t1 / gene=Cvel_4878 / organism=Chromera_velia_CCMP2878 / gene_product=Zinc finger protein 571, putative / transcript_product=Zinc finger protein 571, putative / location=Cvel_scaffold220:37738-38211(-) / protein_length=158 / sequence_SO=supercontig / SO=protein_coding / is_pseudo=false
MRVVVRDLSPRQTIPCRHPCVRVFVRMAGSGITAKSAGGAVSASMVAVGASAESVGVHRYVSTVVIDQHAKNAEGHKSASMGAFEGCVENAVEMEFVSTVAREPTVGIVGEVRFVYTTGTNTSVLSVKKTTRCSWPEGTNRGFDTGMTLCFDWLTSQG